MISSIKAYILEKDMKSCINMEGVKVGNMELEIIQKRNDGLV